ncbi:MAG: hypothetical protein A3K10_10245 [Bacteroidetes bacterium RIFCSPLOWO2_12_FULL_31_6]|nr:MAG: hypothetical protein A3K10_10245 [Bacteroidetes bacterium RIFCSPLOWO2_12_FULL_31_6]
MIKGIFGILLIFFITTLFGQTTEWNKCGLDNLSSLNDFEVLYFNEVFQNRKGDFDFNGKTVAYYTGSSGTTISKKSYYFNGLKNGNNGDKDIHLWQAGGTQLLILNEKEKKLSGGYDVILVSWSKLLKNGKSRKRLVKRLKNNLPNKN